MYSWKVKRYLPIYLDFRGKKISMGRLEMLQTADGSWSVLGWNETTSLYDRRGYEKIGGRSFSEATMNMVRGKNVDSGFRGHRA